MNANGMDASTKMDGRQGEAAKTGDAWMQEYRDAEYQAIIQEGEGN